MVFNITSSKPMEDTMNYSPVSKEESLEDASYASASLRGLSPSRRSWAGRTITILNVALFIASTALFLKSSNITNRQDWALEQVSYFSPLFTRLKIPFVAKVVQGDLFNEDNLLLRQYPSPEVDDAWEALTDVGVVIINKEEVVKLGKDPKKAVKAPPEWGHGENSYLAQPDGQHALHCLNAIRKYAYREHYYPSQTTSPSSSHSPNLTSTSPLQPFHQAHLSHCLHVLLQTLTCDFSTDMITHNWMETQDYPFPDFAINKKCRDHSEILKWQAKERISVDMWIEMSKRGPQPGEEILKLPPKLKAWSQSDVTDGQSEKGH